MNNLGLCLCSCSVFKFVLMIVFTARIYVRVQFVVRVRLVR